VGAGTGAVVAVVGAGVGAGEVVDVGAAVPPEQLAAVQVDSALQ